MKRVFTLGEIVYDIFFKENKPIEARPGGSILNSSITLSRLGLNVFFISDLVNDYIGQQIFSFLKDNHLDHQYLFWHQQGRSRLALAFLNEENEASYIFYKMLNEETPKWEKPEFMPTDLLVIGSYYAIKPAIRPFVKELITSARKQHSLIFYDPNFRKNHRPQLPELLPHIEENIANASLVKASIEDCLYIWNTCDVDNIVKILKNLGAKYIVLTNASNPVILVTPKRQYIYNVPKINPISTVGAGDAFFAGLIYAIQRTNVYNLDDIKSHEWDMIISFAIACSTKVCLSYDNYLNYNDIEELKNQFAFA